MRRAFPWLLLLLAGCTSGVGLAAPRAMNHPVDVAFACFDTSVAGNPVVRPLSDCALIVDVPSNTRTPSTVNPGLHMHALVTQSTRGEVGAVDLIARGVLDSDVSVPGYTFVAVGQLPTVIIVPPTDPTCTYVASRGSVDGRHPGISIIDTRRFRSGAGLDHDPFPLHAPYPLPSAPSDMVLAPDEDGFWITLDVLGVVVHVPILGSCTLGQIDRVVPLFEAVPAGVDDDGHSADLTYACTLPGVPVPPAVTHARTPDVDVSTRPEPVAIAIDAINGWLLVADRALPLIHRVSFDGTLLSPLATGAPVRDVVVTPLVPDSYDLAPDPQAARCGNAVVPAPGVTFSRYVYAIDDTDGTVLAIEYSDPSAANFGAVLAVDVRGARRPDRIGMPIVARRLEIITPQYDTSAADPRVAPEPSNPCLVTGGMGNRQGYGLCLPSDPAPSVPPSPQTLRGVFLVVTGADGSVRFVDVYDLDAPCRGRAFGGVGVTFAGSSASGSCTNPTLVGDTAVYTRRHRPRVQQLLAQFLILDTGPTVYLPAGGSIVLAQDGSTGTQTTGLTNIPTLSQIGTCPAPLGVVWGTTDAPVVCSLVDPFAAIGETWSATYEGAIPGTFTSSANAQVDPTTHLFTGVIDTRIDYCLRGAIGSVEAENPPADGPEQNYHGDVLAITGIMPEANLENMGDLCRDVAGIAQVGEAILPVLVRFDHAYTSPTGAPAQREPYLGRLTMDPLAPIENRALDHHVPCAASSECVTPDHPHDTCGPLNTCLRVPTVSDAMICYGDMLLSIEVRSRGAFTVNGTRTGYASRVARSADGTCAYDGSLDVLRQGRAYDGVLYQNARIAFRPIVSAATSLSEIRMILDGGPSQLGLDLSLSISGTRSMALPSGLRYSPEMWALYAIETERGGLIEMTLRPLARTSTAYQ